MSNLNRALHIFLWSFVFIFIVSCSLQITQVDIWWQLSEGARILHTWALPTAPVAAFGLPATPYFDEYAGYEVVLALLYKIGGFPGLWMVFAAIYLAIIFLPVATSGHKYPAFDFISTLALLFGGILMKGRLQQRPELVGGLLIVILMVVLRQSRLEKIPTRTLVTLFFLFLAWTNIHSSFVLGLFVLGLWLACEILLKFAQFPRGLLLRNAAQIGGTSLIATMLNPYGPQRLLFPFQQALDPGSTALSPEMWPITDLDTTAGILLVIAVALLFWGILTTRGVPLWLTIFSLFAVYMSFKSFRSVNLLASSLLFVYAERTEKSDKNSSLPGPLLLAGNVGLSLLCIFFLFGDAYDFIFSYGEMRREHRVATHAIIYAPDICRVRVSDSNARIPVLCGQQIGSYLSFDRASQFQPFIDSGLSHFANDTKRYFFLLWHAPDAFDLVLRSLHIDYVVVNKETFPWIPILHHLPDWKLVACDSTGMLWQRCPGSTHPLSAADRDRVKQSIPDLLESGEIIGAFDYSTTLDEPAESLRILAQYTHPEWTEAFFNSFCAWVDSLPPEAVKAFLASDHPQHYPLVDAVLSARLGPQVFAKFVATNPAGPRPWFWKALEVRECLLNGETAQARSIFDSISPVPVSSTTYYQLWTQIRPGSPPPSYGQWQTWDDQARQFVTTMSTRLNDRMTPRATALAP